ncbi:MFS transporter [Cryobacterium sp. Y50]|uniref:MFS transporter n=1 Tax=Cryobacterium sp. Y50 TaxID=2048286 RepID=UPI000CE45611|nr:MFS transporter [Cryobacterium sp. Y50]
MICLPRTLVLVVSHAVLVQIITFALQPTLPYAVLDSGASPAILGIISAVFAFPGLLLALPTGHALDRFGERLLLVLGLPSRIGTALLAVIAGSSIVLLILATALLGMGHLAHRTTVYGRQHHTTRTVRFGLRDGCLRGLARPDTRSASADPSRWLCAPLRSS